MRKVIFAINTSIDGYVHYANFSPGEDVFEYFNDLMAEFDLIVYGRKMYEIMFPYWADEANWDNKLDIEFGQTITAVDKIVFSRTLESAEYNTRIVRTDPVAELRKLKQAPGKSISLSSVSMLPELAKAGLVDEFRFVVHPGLVGRGPRLVEDGSLAENLKLKLVESRVFKSGAVALRYLKE
ncbi:MAG TPA: dihydrofolate reductase family protein [Mucilaginibacter sp.]|jgi:dihydrofolate reductase|nr:dihydrofolate reductase family protein [Mucilaginibacter sp.]